MTGLRHSVRDSAISREKTFVAQGNELVVHDSRRKTEIRYSDIVGLTVGTYLGIGGTHGQTTVKTRARRKVKIRSHHYGNSRDFENRSHTYAPLIRDLFLRVARANPDARFAGGSRLLRIVWLLLLCLLIGIGVLLAFALLAPDIDRGGIFAGLSVVLVSLPLAWQGVRKSRSGSLDPHKPPAELLEL